MTGFTVFSCGRRPAEPEPLCDICRANPATLGCQFELRGAKAGQVCGKRLCRGCSVLVMPVPPSMVATRVCPPHAAFLKREAGR